MVAFFVVMIAEGIIARIDPADAGVFCYSAYENSFRPFSSYDGIANNCVFNESFIKRDRNRFI